MRHGDRFAEAVAEWWNNPRVKRLAGMIALLLVLVGAETAPAAVEVGSRCEAHTGLLVSDGIVFPFTAGDPLPSSSPTNGVATSWTVHTGSTDTHYQGLKVLRTTSDPDVVEVVAETPREAVTKGSGPIPIRFPILRGDRFGLSGSLGVPVCDTDSTTDVIGVTQGSGQPGQRDSFHKLSGYQLALSVVVEPDLDGDGYGDESQEPCPELITLQAPCPPVTFEKSAELKPRGILIGVKVSSLATVQVFGQVGWQVRATGSRDHRFIVALNGGNARTVLPNRGARFRLPLGRLVMRRLAQLELPRSLRAQMIVRVTDLAGRVAERRFRLRLPGRG
jgi:hypothetical protein